MTWSAIYRGLKAVAGLSGLMAFIGFSYTYYKDVAARESARAQSWQAVEIFSRVLESGDQGISLDELVSAVQRSMIEGRVFNEVNPNIATEDQVLKGIIELSAKNAVIMGTDDRFRVPLQFATMLGQEAQWERINLLQELALQTVHQNPGKFSSDELRELMRRNGGTEVDIQRAITPLLMSGPWGPPALVATEANSASPRYEQKLEVLR